MEPRRDLIDPERLEIRGRRVIMRVLRREDVGERYVRWLNDVRVNEYSDRRYHVPYTLDDALGYFASMRRDELLLGVWTKPLGHIGNVKVGPIDWGNEAAEIAIMLGEPSSWNKGIGREVMYNTAHFLFDTCGLHRVDAASCNPAFLRLVERLGWKVEGVQRERVHLNGEFVPFTWVGLIDREFIRQPDLESLPECTSSS